MRIIDAHAHLGTWGDFFVPRPDAVDLVATLTNQGVEAAGVSHLVGVGHDAAAGNLRVLAELAAHPGRLGGWLVASPHIGDAATLRDQLATPGTWGLKLHPDTHAVRLDDPRYDPFLDLAEDLGVAVLTHTQAGSRWSDPSLAAEVARRRPTVPLLMGHGGLDQDSLLATARLTAAWENIYFESCSSRLTRRWLARIVAEAGPTKVLYGSDAVFLDPRTAVGRLLAAPMTDTERELVAAGNIARLLGDRLLLTGVSA